MPNLTDIPGIPQIWTRTKGDPCIKIAILDGAADLERSCFQGAKFSQFKPYWSEDIELNEEYYYYLNLYLDFNQQQKDKKDDPDHDKEEAKKDKCLNCGTQQDRDENAAKNINKVGIGHCHDSKRARRQSKTT